MLEVQERIALGFLPETTGLSILDVGGGHGQLARPLERDGHSVTILGSDPLCEERLTDLTRPGRLRFVAGPLVPLPFEDRSFDVVLAFRLLTHYPDWRRLVAELARVARQTVIVDYPPAGGLQRFAGSLFRAKNRLETHTRPWHPLSHDEIGHAFGHADFSVTDKCGEYLMPMVIHRIMGSRRLSSLAEGLLAGTGLTGRFGSPVILRAERIELADQSETRNPRSS